jgi:hypothetical protein
MLARQTMTMAIDPSAASLGRIITRSYFDSSEPRICRPRPCGSCVLLPDGWRASDLRLEQLPLTRLHDSELFFWHIDNKAANAFDLGSSKQILISFARKMAWLQSLEILKSLQVHYEDAGNVETIWVRVLAASMRQRFLREVYNSHLPPEIRMPGASDLERGRKILDTIKSMDLKTEKKKVSAHPLSTSYQSV